MISFENRTDFDLNLDNLEKILTVLSDKEVELVLIDNEDIQELNRVYRDIDKPTDVLSFPLEEMPYAPMGTVVVSIDKAKEKSEELGHSIEDEISLLFIHGVLHLLGFDHETDNGEMRVKEIAIIKVFGLPKSLIVRNL